jgi:hypothetical protein
VTRKNFKYFPAHFHTKKLLFPSLFSFFSRLFSPFLSPVFHTGTGTRGDGAPGESSCTYRVYTVYTPSPVLRVLSTPHVAHYVRAVDVCYDTSLRSNEHSKILYYDSIELLFAHIISIVLEARILLFWLYCGLYCVK